MNSDDSVSGVRILVIGAGIVGASAAYSLAERGVSTVLVDRQGEGQATAAGLGVIFPGALPGVSETERAFGQAAFEYYGRLVERLRAAGVTDPGYDPVGLITVVEPDELDQAYDETLWLRDQAGMTGLGELERLEPGGPAERFPVLRDDLAGVFTAGFVRLDGRTMRDALIEQAVRHGAERRTGEAVLRPAGGDGVEAIVDGEPVRADAVIVAAGAWSGRLTAPLGVELPVFPIRGQIAHLTVTAADTAADTGEWPMIRSEQRGFLLGFPGGRVVTTGTVEPDAGFDFRTTAGGVHTILTDALALAPKLADAMLAEIRVGFRPGTHDGHPLLGPLAAVPRVVVATGLGTMGLSLGPYTGAVAADLAIGRGADLDLHEFRPDR